MNKTTKILIQVALTAVVLVLAYLVFDSIMRPLRFNEETQRREKVAIERLKALRTLEVAYKEENGVFVQSLDSLLDFYYNGEVTIVKQIGSFDDSLAVAQNLVRRDTLRVPVKEAILTDLSFPVDSIIYIPFSGGRLIEVNTVVRKVSGIDVPLFEANIHYDFLLSGLDRQLVINFKEEQESLERYKGIKVGSIERPNNNAGNWE